MSIFEPKPLITKKKQSHSLKKKVLDFLKGFLQALGLALLFRVFLFEPYTVPSSSMYPSILIGDRMLANKFYYGFYIPGLDRKIFQFQHPKTGDITLFQAPSYKSPGLLLEMLNFVTFGLFGLDNTMDNPKFYVKRLIGEAGDMIFFNPQPTQNYIKDSKNQSYHVFVNGKKASLKRTKLSFEKENDVAVNFDDFEFFEENLKNKIHLVQFDKPFDTELPFFQYQGLQDDPDYRGVNIEGDMYVPKKGDSLEFIVLNTELLNQNSQIQNLITRDNSSAKESWVWIPRNLKVKMFIRSQKKQNVTLSLNLDGDFLNRFYATPYLDNQILSSKKITQLLKEGTVKIKIKENYYFVMGDNRDHSRDGRIWGFVPEYLFVGVPLIRYWPLNRFGKID